MVALKIHKSHPDARFSLPASGNVGVDLYSCERVVIPPAVIIDKPPANFEIKAISAHQWLSHVLARPLIDRYVQPHIARINTGVHLGMPENIWAQIVEKSSIAGGAPDKGIPGGLIVLGGIIDTSYRGPLVVCLANLSLTEQVLEAGQKIAQLVFHHVVLPPYIEEADSVEALGETVRGTNGFGSTGKFEAVHG